MELENISTEELERRDIAITKSIRALKSWANRDLSKKNRAKLIEALCEEADAIMTELMKREGNQR
jgi:hypothetical protein